MRSGYMIGSDQRLYLACLLDGIQESGYPRG